LTKTESMEASCTQCYTQKKVGYIVVVIGIIPSKNSLKTLARIKLHDQQFVGGNCTIKSLVDLAEF
jgi:hypothetical protein